jgi:allantoicase
MTDQPDFVDTYIDLAQPRLGAQVIEASDDFFAPKERLIKPEPPVFVPDKYDDHGKWMDGWESRRKRVEGHDYCIVRLCPGVIHGVTIDTRFFTGNYPPAASLDVCNCEGDPVPDTVWHPLLPLTSLQGDRQHFYEIDQPGVWTHIRLNIFPDGGVARLRVYGVVHHDSRMEDPAESVDLAAMTRGGRALACNDMHYGHMSNLIAPGRGVNMGDGWETRRRRAPGNDWVILQLGSPGVIQRVEVDTAYFKGNYPARCSLHGALLDAQAAARLSADSPVWREILPPVPLGPDCVQTFESEISPSGAVSHVRFDIYPDGGVSRLRLFGLPKSR